VIRIARRNKGCSALARSKDHSRHTSFIDQP